MWTCLFLIKLSRRAFAEEDWVHIEEHATEDLQSYSEGSDGEEDHEFVLVLVGRADGVDALPDSLLEGGPFYYLWLDGDHYAVCCWQYRIK